MTLGFLNAVSSLLRACQAAMNEITPTWRVDSLMYPSTPLGSSYHAGSLRRGRELDSATPRSAVDRRRGRFGAFGSRGGQH